MIANRFHLLEHQGSVHYSSSRRSTDVSAQQLKSHRRSPEITCESVDMQDEEMSICERNSMSKIYIFPFFQLFKQKKQKE